MTEGIYLFYEDYIPHGIYRVSIRIQVKVQSKARFNRLEVDDGIFRIYVTAAPENGKANKAVIEILAKMAGVPKRDIVLVIGHTSRNKVFEIKGYDSTDRLTERICA